MSELFVFWLSVLSMAAIIFGALYLSYQKGGWRAVGRDLQDLIRLVALFVVAATVLSILRELNI